MPSTLLPASGQPTGTQVSGAELRPAALRLKEAARYVGMSESWLAHSDMPRVRLGSRATVYLIADLDAYLTARRSHGTAA